MAEVEVREDGGACSAETTPIDDAGVVELVGDDEVARFGQALEEAEVGGVPRGEENPVFLVKESSEFELEVAMGALRAGDEPRTSGTERSFSGGLKEGFGVERRGCEAQIIVAGEAEEGLPVDAYGSTQLSVEGRGASQEIFALKVSESGGGIFSQAHFACLAPLAVSVRVGVSRETFRDRRRSTHRVIMIVRSARLARGRLADGGGSRS